MPITDPARARMLAYNVVVDWVGTAVGLPPSKVNPGGYSRRIYVHDFLREVRSDQRQPVGRLFLSGAVELRHWEIQARFRPKRATHRSPAPSMITTAVFRLREEFWAVYWDSRRRDYSSRRSRNSSTFLSGPSRPLLM
jgi:hypothetical protein